MVKGILIQIFKIKLNQTYVNPRGSGCEYKSS